MEPVELEKKATEVRTDGRLPGQIRPVRFQNGIAPHATGVDADGVGQYAGDLRGLHRGGRAALDEGAGGDGGLDHRRVFDAAVFDVAAEAAGQHAGKDRRSVAGDPAADRAGHAAGIDLEKLGQRTIWVDCDVLQADGGTRTAAITGAYVALTLAVRKLMSAGKLAVNPMLHEVAAVSVGWWAERCWLDLCYEEDVAASVDMNLVMNSKGEFIELQGTGEESTFSEEELGRMLAVGKAAIQELVQIQRAVLA